MGIRVLLFVVLWSLCLSSHAQVIENPVFDRTDVPAFHIDKITLTKDATIISCTYAAEANSWANISEETYLLDTNTNKRYPIQKCDGLPYAPEKREFLY